MKILDSLRTILFSGALLLGCYSFSASAQGRYLALADSADVALQREDWARAAQFIEEALKTEPGNFNNALLLSNLGTARTQLGMFLEALEAFRIGLAITPRSTVLLTNRARTLLAMERYDDALTDLSQALQIDPALVWPRKMKGYLLLQKGNIKEAHSDFERLQQLCPTDADPFLGLAECELASGNFAKAITLLSNALELDEDNLDALMLRAQAYLNSGRPEAAYQDLNEALAIDPEDPEIYLFRAAANIFLYQPSKAEEDKKNAIAKGLDPQIVDDFLSSLRR